MNFQFRNELKGKDYLASAMMQLFNPAVQAIYLAAAFLMAWMLRSAVAEDFFVTSQVLTGTLCLYVLMSAIFVGMSCIRQKKNMETIVNTFGYQKSEVNGESYVEYFASTVSETNWREFHKIRENDDYFLLYAMKKRFVLLPKRVLPAGCADALRGIAIRLKDRPAQAAGASAAEGMQNDAGTGGDETGWIVTWRRFGDNVAFNLYHAYVFRKNMIVSTALFSLFIIASGLLALATGDFSLPVLLFLMLALMHAGVLAIAAAASLRYRKQPMRILYRFTGEGFEVRHRFGQLSLEWDKLYIARQTGSYYFLFFSKTQAAVVPKRDLDAETTAKIDGAIRAHNLSANANRRRT